MAKDAVAFSTFCLLAGLASSILTTLASPSSETGVRSERFEGDGLGFTAADELEFEFEFSSMPLSKSSISRCVPFVGEATGVFHSTDGCGSHDSFVERVCSGGGGGVE
jgi:hypothetical protein